MGLLTVGYDETDVLLPASQIAYSSPNQLPHAGFIEIILFPKIRVETGAHGRGRHGHPLDSCGLRVAVG